MSPSDSSFTKVGDTASHSNLSSCDVALLTVAHQALMIVSVSTSLRNVQWKRQPLDMFPSALSFSHSAAWLPTAKALFPGQQCPLTRWSIINSFPESSPHLRHGLLGVLFLMHPHTCHQPLLNRVTACVRSTDNTTEFSASKSHTRGLISTQFPNCHCNIVGCAGLCCVKLN